MRTFALATILCLLAGALPAQTQSKGETKTVTGIVDQQEADFIVSDAEKRQPIAVLQGVGFDNQNFARFVGKPVRVKGTLIQEKGRNVLRVRQIADIQEIAPEKQ